MIISPPFLLSRNANESETSWLDRRMPPDPAGTGLYPVSYALAWHGGSHLIAPPDAQGRFEPVRAIADGEVVHCNDSEPLQTSLTHPLTYGSDPKVPTWTDKGCVVLRHKTEIGADGSAPVEVVFYSVYMHLKDVDPAVKLGKQVNRKSALGKAGHCYGTSNLLQLEILCDDANLARLTGRTSGLVDVTKDGRSSTVFGEMYFHLPAGTVAYRTLPGLAVRQVPNTVAALAPTAEPLFVGMLHSEGTTTLQTYRRNGSTVDPAPVPQKDGEYDLYANAKKLADAMRKITAGAKAPATSVPSVSACYELLRFGRTLGPDVLTPHDTPHWREVPLPGGSKGWVNLNVAGVTKFSDADFPHWRQWEFIDDSADQDSRCDSATIRKLLDTDMSGKVTPEEANEAVKLAVIKSKLARLICKFTTEWEAASIDRRWAWLKQGNAENLKPLTEGDFGRFKDHCAALAFWSGSIGLPAMHWRFQPRAFIENFKKCGWISKNELIGSTRKTVLGKAGTEVEATTKADMERRLQSGSVRRPADLHIPFQAVARKYGICGCMRMAHLLGQLAEETGRMEFMVELGPPSYFSKYEPSTDQGRKLGNTKIGDGANFKGRGIIQITGRTNYENYGDFKSNDYLSAVNAATLATNAFLTCDASGFYWTAKQRINKDKKGNQINNGSQGINYWADRGASEENALQVTKCINPAAVHFKDTRWPCFEHAYFNLNDQAVAPKNFITIDR